MKQAVADKPVQVERLGEVEALLRDWQINVTEPNIALRRQIGDAKTMNDMAKLVGEARGKEYFDKFRAQIATFIGREQTLLDTRRSAFEQATATVEAIIRNQLSTKTILINLKSMKENEARVSHSFNAIALANEVLISAVDMETGVRGYLLAGHEDFLESYVAGREHFDDSILDLRDLVNDNSKQLELLSKIDVNIKAWLSDVVEPMIALRREIGDAKTMDDMADLVREEKGRIYFDNFRLLMADFAIDEEDLLAARQKESDETLSNAEVITVIAIVLGGGLAVLIAWFVGQGIAKPIVKMTEAMSALAKGELDVSISAEGRKDEVGKMAEAVVVFKDNMIEAERLNREKVKETEQKEAERQRVENLIKGFEGTVVSVLDKFNQADSAMGQVSGEVKNTAEKTLLGSTNVAVSSEQATRNVEAVATAADELSSSIHEIGRQVTQANQVSTNAVEKANLTSVQFKVLEENVAKISDIVDLINDIADQTNLLALNATIEAARGGEAGKGFAVVAAEVKNLANQTSQATEEITTQIAEVQNSTRNSVAAIEQISTVIGDINEITTAIAASVEEQGAATSEIARNVDEAAIGTRGVLTTIAEVQGTAEAASQAASKITDTSSSLSSQSSLLRKEVTTFLQEVQLESIPA